MDQSKNRVRLRVWGDRACFTRPEMKVERVSYDVITPSAARGLLEAIYWKPQIRWIVEEVRVLKPIRFTNVRRNEVGSVATGPSKKMLGGKPDKTLGLFIEQDRQQRAATILTDVDYLISARYRVLDSGDPPQKHYEIFRRRAEKGQCFQQPYFGCREFPASFQWHEGPPPPCPDALRGQRELGYMLHDIVFVPDGKGKIVESHRGRKCTAEPRFFRAEMIDGVVAVPELDDVEVKA